MIAVSEWPVDTSVRHRWRDIRRLDHQGMILPSMVCVLCGATPFGVDIPLPCRPFCGDFAAKFAALVEMELQA